MTTNSADLSTCAESYPEGEVRSLELVWGDGFLSPGGSDAVARIVHGVDLSGKQVLDIGCGLGGPTIILVRDHGAAHVVGVDVVDSNLSRAAATIDAHGLSDRITLRRAAQGPLLFADASFDVVFSKDALIEAQDRELVLAEAFRVLRPGGWLLASDWLRADGPVSSLLQHWIDFSGSQEAGHSFRLASASETQAMLERLGFADVQIESENTWYRDEARRELELKRQHWDAFVRLRGERDAEQSCAWHEKMISVLDSGDFQPSRFRARKPACSTD
jgi:phosphoethanolamine N-methyltransferase